MPTESQRTIKISGEAYKMLTHESEKEEKPMGEIASAIICAALNIDVYPKVATAEATDRIYTNSGGEQYDLKTGKRIYFR